MISKSMVLGGYYEIASSLATLFLFMHNHRQNVLLVRIVDTVQIYIQLTFIMRAESLT
jgi:hypothetical protein